METNVIEKSKASMFERGMGGELAVVASNPAEMAVAQKRLVDVARTKLDDANAEVGQAENVYNALVLGGTRAGSAAGLLRRAKQRAEFLEKTVYALEAGYLIVPDMPGEIIAIKRRNTVPDQGESRGRWTNNEAHDHLPPGKGIYVDPQPKSQRFTRTANDRDGKPYQVQWVRPVKMRQVDLPVKFMKPTVIERTIGALKTKIFDDLVLVPGRKRRVDPFVIGRLHRPWVPTHQANRTLAFMVAWFLDIDDI